MLKARSSRTWFAVTFLAVTLAATVSTRTAFAQERPIVVEGRVEWIAGEVMVVSPYGLVLAPGGTSAINIDLSQVSQDQYEGLTEGDSVLVRGVVSPSRTRVIATSIERTEPPY
jgi:hypothetical protein